MRLPDTESEEHRCYHHLNKFCLLWNVQFGMICVCVCVCAPGNDFLRLDLEELF